MPAPRALAASAFARPAEALFSESRRPLFAGVSLSGIDGARPWRRAPIFVGICRFCTVSGGSCRHFQALLSARRSFFSGVFRSPIAFGGLCPLLAGIFVRFLRCADPCAIPARRSTRCHVAPFFALPGALSNALFGALARRTFGRFVRSAVLAHSFCCADKNFMRHGPLMRLFILERRHLQPDGAFICDLFSQTTLALLRPL